MTPEPRLQDQVAPVESTYTVEGALILANDLARTKHENAELRRLLASARNMIVESTPGHMLRRAIDKAVGSDV